jgi:hypothetical protein
MCNPISFLQDDKGKLYYFNLKQRHNPPKNISIDQLDSHSAIAEFFKVNEDECNKWEFNPLTDKFELDNKVHCLNVDKSKVKVFHNLFKDIMESANENMSFKLITRGLTRENSVKLAIFSAKQVIDIFEEKYPDDARPRKAIEAAEEWLKNPDTGAAAHAASAAAYTAYTAAYTAAHAAAHAASAADSAAADAAAHAAYTAADAAAHAASAAASAAAYAAAHAAYTAADAAAHAAYTAASADAAADAASAAAYAHAAAAAAYAAADAECKIKIVKYGVKLWKSQQK